MRKVNVKWIVTIGMLSSIAYILMLLKFPIPPFPTFLKIDFSDIPALIATLIMGPGAGILVELIKNVLDYFMTGSETGVPVGHFANFIAGITYILPTYYIYQKFKSKKGMTYGLIFGTAFMAIMMSILNYYVVLPAYSMFLNMPAMTAAETRQMIVAGILPFNIVKGIVVTIVFVLLFNRMSTWINKQTSYV